ncbi:MAG: hypothetical protein HY903_10135 [Deltaproteobacteria bacterium]|nr:hypothetical protein [Deltaproteobacteria bacterium]
MADKDKDDKQAKRQARGLWEESRALFAAGDYRSLRALHHKLLATAPDSDVATKAKEELDNLKIEPWAIYAGAGSLVLYVLAWVVSLA